MSLRLDDIHAGYGTTRVLRGVSICLPVGSVVAVLGANGAGKTTLLRVASGLLAPTSGAVRIDSEDLTSSPTHEFARRGVCHVPEGRGIFRTMTVAENITLQARRGEEREALDRAVEVFPVLGERLTQIAGTLSGGEQQMLALARSYDPAARFVLLDEVSLGLAPKIVDEIFDYLERLARAGASLLLVEQYVVRALHLADYVYVLNRGEVAFAGEPAELDEAEVFTQYTGVH